MTILCDIDSTITDFAKVLLDTLNAHYGTSYTYSEIDHWNWFNEHFDNPWTPLNYTDFWDAVTINPQAVSVLEEMVLSGDKVYLVTASSFTDTLGYKIRKTLEAFNPKLINENNVIVAYDKSVIQGDVLIDDGVHNLKNSIATRKICANQPWNQAWEGYRAYNWEYIGLWFSRLRCIS